MQIIITVTEYNSFHWLTAMIFHRRLVAGDTSYHLPSCNYTYIYRSSYYHTAKRRPLSRCTLKKKTEKLHCTVQTRWTLRSLRSITITSPCPVPFHLRFQISSSFAFREHTLTWEWSTYFWPSLSS